MATTYSPRVILTFSTPIPPDASGVVARRLCRRMFVAANHILPRDCILECTDAVIASELGRKLKQRWSLDFKIRRSHTREGSIALSAEEVNRYRGLLENLVRNVLKQCGPLGGPVDAYYISNREWRVMFSPPKRRHAL